MNYRMILFSLLLYPFACFAQEKNQILMDTILNREVLIGYCDRKGFDLEEFAIPYKDEYALYSPETSVLSELSDHLQDFRITIVMGTWCGDSKEQVPRFFKILDLLHYPEDWVTLICVDRGKKAGPVDISDLQIEKVPTFIFSRDGRETGRIIETPSESLERDMLEIIISGRP